MDHYYYYLVIFDLLGLHATYYYYCTHYRGTIGCPVKLQMICIQHRLFALPLHFPLPPNGIIRPQAWSFPVTRGRFLAINTNNN